MAITYEVLTKSEMRDTVREALRGYERDYFLQQINETETNTALEDKINKLQAMLNDLKDA